MTLVVSIIIFAFLAVFMELVAWATHKYVMHGFLWALHRDHHQPKGRGLQKNDAFSVFFALVAMALIFLGWYQRSLPLAAAGAGITLYGVGYFLFHEVMFHRRLSFFRLPARGSYLKRIVNAHRNHHRVRDKRGNEPFSFLYASKRYEVPG